MRLQIKLVDGDVLEIDVDPDDWSQAFGEAQRRGTLIEIENEQGDRLTINPQLVRYATFFGEGKIAPVESLQQRRDRLTGSPVDSPSETPPDRRRDPAG
jgi:hypothetical protein